MFSWLPTETNNLLLERATEVEWERAEEAAGSGYWFQRRKIVFQDTALCPLGYLAPERERDRETTERERERKWAPQLNRRAGPPLTVCNSAEPCWNQSDRNCPGNLILVPQHVSGQSFMYKKREKRWFPSKGSDEWKMYIFHHF